MKGPAERTRLSRKLEKKAASDFGGRRHSGSGAPWQSKDDGSGEGFRMEHKFTDGRYRFDPRDFAALKKRAHGHDQIPVFVIDLRASSTVVAVLSEADATAMELGISNETPVTGSTFLFDPVEARERPTGRLRFENGVVLVFFPYHTVLEAFRRHVGTDRIS